MAWFLRTQCKNNLGTEPENGSLHLLALEDYSVPKFHPNQVPGKKRKNNS